MSEITGIFLVITAYTCIAIFLWRVLWRLLLLYKTSKDSEEKLYSVHKTSAFLMFKMIGDIFFLTRLFRMNKPLWIGEWVFHSAFLLVLLRHMRYFLYPVPEWVLWFQTPGIYAGYVLPLSLIYILIMKLGIEKKTYFSSYNFFLLLLLLSASVTGIVMKDFLRADLVEIKYFVFNILTIKPIRAPNSVLFIIHFILTFVFLASLPTHIFTAPLTLFDARRREEGLNRLIHEK
jgi:nitrate reductase gamma subunit